MAGLENDKCLTSPAPSWLAAMRLFPLCFCALRCQSMYLVSYWGKLIIVLAIPAAFSVFTQFHSVTEKKESPPYKGQNLAQMPLSASLLCHWPALGPLDTLRCRVAGEGKNPALKAGFAPGKCSISRKGSQGKGSQGVAHSRDWPCKGLEMNEIPFIGGTENRQWMGTNMETTAQSEGAELGMSASYVHATTRHLPTFLRGYQGSTQPSACARETLCWTSLQCAGSS